MTKPNEIDRSATSKTITRANTQTESAHFGSGGGCGAPAQAILDDCRCNLSQKLLHGRAEAGNLGSGLTALVCGGKRVN